MQWAFLTDAGRGMLQQRTEYATAALKDAKANDKTYYRAPTSRMFASPTLLVVDPSTLKGPSIQMLSSGTDDPAAREPFANFNHMLGLGDNTPLSWVFKQDKQAYQDRQLLADLMRPTRFHLLTPIIARKLDEQLEILKNPPPDFCLYQWIHQLTMDIIAEHVLGLEHFPSNAHAILDKAETAIVRETEPFHVFGYDIPITSSQQRYEQAKIDFQQLAKDLVDNNEEAIIHHDGYMKKILDIEAKNRNLLPEDALQHPDVRKILSCAAAGLLFASGTLSTSLTTGLMFLDADVADRLRSTKFSDTNDQDFMDAFFKEALRYTSSAAHNLRYASCEKTLETTSGEKIAIPKDSYIVIDHRSSHQNTDTWDHPQEFNPARFFAEDAPKLNTSKFTPFSLGPRMCPGRMVAEHIFKAVVTFMIENNISINVKDQEFKNIRNEEYWTASDFVTRLRTGKKIHVDVKIDNNLITRKCDIA